MKSQIATTKTREEIIDFLRLNGINAELSNLDDCGFSRTIDFKVYDIDYRIIWYHNESNLCVGHHNRAAKIPFKYIYFDVCFPLVGGNRSIGFSYTKQDKKSMFDREFPYEVFRIPLELKE
jgi:hypothetical protein